MTPTPIPDLTISNSAPANAVAGTPFDYTLTVSNSGTAAATGVVAEFTLPTGVTFNSATEGGSFSNPTLSNGTLTFTGGSLTAGKTATLTVDVTPTTSGTLTSGTTVVDPNNTIAESNENNNTAAPITTTVSNSPPPSTTPNTLVQTSSQVLQLQGDSGASAQLQFTKVSHSSNLVNEIGVFVVDDNAGSINGILPGQPGYLTAALGKAQVIFSVLGNTAADNAFDDATTPRQLGLPVGSHLGFYLVQNDTTNTVLSDLAAGQAPPNVFFSLPAGNSNNANHLQLSAGSNGSFSLGWNAATGGGSNFNDLVVNLQVTTNPATPATALQAQPQQQLLDLRDPQLGSTVQADFVINNEAAYHNFAGFYTVDDVTGRVGNLEPGDPGYAQAALQRSVTDYDRSTPTKTAQLPGGTLLAPFLIANATRQDFLSQNPTDQAGNGPKAYFAYIGANPDKVDHVRLLGDNKFGFEDLYGGGDRDFNDIVLQVKNIHAA